MKLAYTTLACPGWTIEQAVAAASQYGYAGIEMRLIGAQTIGPDLPDAMRQRGRTRCREAQLPIGGVDPSGQVAQPDPAIRDAQVRDGLAMLELAAQWEAPYIRVFGMPPQDADPVQADAGAAEALTRLGERAAALGLTVLLETHDAFASGQRVAAVLARVPASAQPGVGALWDTLHPFRVREALADTTRLLQPWLRHVHIKDGQPPAESSPESDRWDLKLLGEGAVPMLDILRWLKAAGYDGWLSVEWEKRWHPDLAEPEIALPQHAERLRGYLQTL